MAKSPATDSGERLHLADRLALRPKEAADALGISERTLRQLLPELPHLRAGGCVMIPVDGLRQWLSEQAKAGKNRVDAAVDEVLASISSE
jgi:excisionase family DNA binding protein